MDAYQARKVIDAFEKAEKILQNRPPLPKDILPSYLKMLDKIYELDQKGKERGSDVASALHQTKPSITRALCAMDAMGWITKEDSVTDKRVVYIVLTDKGREIHQHYIASYYSALSKRLEKYKEEEKMEEYAIEVHALKSDSKYLGFKELAEIAYNQEMKSKENDIKYIKEKYSILKEEVDRIVKIIKEYQATI